MNFLVRPLAILLLAATPAAAAHAQADRQAFSSILPLADGGIILFGEFGVTLVPASALGAS